MFYARAEPQDFVEDAVRDFALGHFRERQIAAIAREQGDDVGAHIETRTFSGDIVGDDQVGVFLREFFARILGDIAGFGGKSNDQAISFLARDSGEDIGIRFQSQRDLFRGFLYFLCGDYRGTVVGDGRGENGSGGLRKVIFDGTQHFRSGAHIYACYTRGSFKRGRPADHNYLRAALRSGLGNRVPHSSRGAIGQESYWVEIFLGGAGGQKNCLPFEVTAYLQNFAHRGNNRLLTGQASRAGHAAGEIAFVRIYNLNAANAQTVQIFLSSRMIPHVDVHGRSDYH